MNTPTPKNKSVLEGQIEAFEMNLSRLAAIKERIENANSRLLGAVENTGEKTSSFPEESSLMGRFNRNLSLLEHLLDSVVRSVANLESAV